ncbi:MAG: heavy-metal-associated domain-containing protein [Methylococcales symbiont of Hymedesmia sp. n. MRB-2018]|nr:MAG: heavy-metal-associated domain-containing protein [Methylococcales symbiont of Hymedesmia sp. n. MRB-2018]
MKNILIFLLLITQSPISIGQAETAIKKPLKNATVILDIQNMTCPVCKYTIKKALEVKNGLQQVTINYDAKTATINFDPTKTSPDRIVKIITNIGYPAKLQAKNQ